VNDTYTVLLREKKLPLALLEDPAAKRGAKEARASLTATQPFAQAFGAKQTRKRPRLAAETYADLLGRAADTGAQCVSSPK
jgi:nuclear GTP-binding protein